jgi:hypothetical protein
MTVLARLTNAGAEEADLRTAKAHFSKNWEGERTR